jgi:hypothetical protein
MHSSGSGINHFRSGGQRNGSGIPHLANALIKDGVIQDTQGKLIFRQDYIFNSPSTAAGVLLGRSSNGWQMWKKKAGMTLDELKRS